MKRVRDSLTVQIHIMRPEYLNGSGRLFGGRVMEWIDETAGAVARRHTGMNVTTATVDTMDFKAPAYNNQMIMLIGYMTYVGNTSMEVCVETYVEDPNGHREEINTAYLVLVAMDENDHPAKVPGLELVSENDKIIWAEAEERNRRRKELRKVEKRTTHIVENITESLAGKVCYDTCER